MTDQIIKVKGYPICDYKRKLSEKDKEYLEAFNEYNLKPTEKNKERFGKALDDKNVLENFHEHIREERRRRDECLAQKGLKDIRDVDDIETESPSLYESKTFSKRKNSIFAESYLHSKQYRKDLINAIQNKNAL